MSVFDDFDLILDYAHMWNWAPDWYWPKASIRSSLNRTPFSPHLLIPIWKK